jgi:hypothetical protein
MGAVVAFFLSRAVGTGPTGGSPKRKEDQRGSSPWLLALSVLLAILVIDRMAS